MRNEVPDKLEEYRTGGRPGDWNGRFQMKGMCIQTSNGGGWDHVSVSFKTRCPTWGEMCFVDAMCFKDEEVSMQIHPARSDYRSHHPFCLHLWRPQSSEELAVIRAEWAADGEEWPDEYPTESVGEIPLPPGSFVAPEESIKT